MCPKYSIRVLCAIFVFIAWGETGERCRSCHGAAVDSYARTGMARSVRKMQPAYRVEDFAGKNRFLHGPSRSQFVMTEREGRFFVARQARENVPAMELEIHYVLGSGNHARGYLHRTPQGRLVSLPVTWYAENGGYWDMAPGYDRPDHPHFRRKAGFDCLFCHDSYPRANADPEDPIYMAPLPEGIGCERCHGDPAAHLAKPGRSTIFNPRRQTPQRQDEVCMQCHLETTSHPLPASIRRIGRGPFDYSPGEPLSDFAVHFDHAPGGGFDDKFEVVSAPYRLRQSRCYKESGGRLTCITCHDPHQPARANDGACVSCHRPDHGEGPRCSSCHMATRRPEDAPRTTITDHRIARRPDRGPAPVHAGAYAGAVAPYYPADPGELYTLLANPDRMIARLRETLAAAGPPSPEPYVILSDALARRGDRRAAEMQARRAAGIDPEYVPAWRRIALLTFPSPKAARDGLRRAPRDPVLLTVLGEALRTGGDLDEAARMLESAIAEDPLLPDAFVNLGALHALRGNREQAERRFSEALAVDPGNAAAAANLRRLRATNPGK